MPQVRYKNCLNIFTLVDRLHESGQISNRTKVLLAIFCIDKEGMIDRTDPSFTCYWQAVLCILQCLLLVMGCLLECEKQREVLVTNSTDTAENASVVVANSPMC